jgi:mono/diheme cytochrome c family protein
MMTMKPFEYTRKAAPARALCLAVVLAAGLASASGDDGAAQTVDESTTPPSGTGSTIGQGMTDQGMMEMMGAGGMMMGLYMPTMDPARGRKLFASKGCVVCHSINGVGGEDATALDASTMRLPMNPFDFVAKMWRGAQAMITVQEEELGGQIVFDGGELADIIAFVHTPQEQARFSEADIPKRIRDLMAHLAEEGHTHGDEEEATSDE